MPRTITVKGIGKVSTKPDYAEISIKLEAKDKKYEKAMDKSATQLSQLKEALVKAGFEKDALKTINFDVSTEYDSHRDAYDNYKNVFSGFVCVHRLKLSFDFKMEKVSLALSTISSCLANPELSISFTVKDATAINESLLSEATINARKKAEILCAASGVELGELLSINYDWGEVNVYSRTRYDMTDDQDLDGMAIMGAPVDINPDDINVSDTATFIWEIEQN